MYKLFFFFLSIACLGQEICVETLQQQRKEASSKTTIGTALYQIDTIQHQAAVVFFYKTSCPYCQKAMPELLKLQQKYGSKGFRVIAISLDENLEEWQTYIKNNHYEQFTNYCDGKSYLGIAPTKLNVFGTPTFFLIDKEWKIYNKPKNMIELESYIKELVVL